MRISGKTVFILKQGLVFTWRRHQMETFSALLALCAGNSTVTGEFPSERPVMWSFDVFFDLRFNKRLSKQSWVWWFETSSRSLWRQCNELQVCVCVRLLRFDIIISFCYSKPASENRSILHSCIIHFQLNSSIKLKMYIYILSVEYMGLFLRWSLCQKSDPTAYVDWTLGWNSLDIFCWKTRICYRGWSWPKWWIRMFWPQICTRASDEWASTVLFVVTELNHMFKAAQSETDCRYHK